MFARFAVGRTEEEARRRRACFLEGLIPLSVSSLASCPLKVTPCSTAEAYLLFVAITGCLGIPIDVAARQLEAEVRRS